MSLETLTEKVEQLIDYAGLKHIIQDVIDTIGGAVFQHWQLSEEQIYWFDFSKTPSLSNTFRNNKLITTLIINAPQTTRLDNMVNGCGNLKTVVLTDTSKVCEWSNAFASATNIKSIKTLNFISATSWLTSCVSNLPVLETIEIVPETIPTSINFIKSVKLSLESGKNILLGLHNHSGTDSEFVNTVTLPTQTVALLEADGNTAPNGMTWADYVHGIGWNM